MSLAALLAYTDPNRQEDRKQPKAEGALARLLAMTEPPPEPTVADRAKESLLQQRDVVTATARGAIDQGVLGTVAGATRVAGYGASGLVQGAKDASAQLGIGEAGARDWQIKKLETERDVLWGKRERQGTPFSDAERDRALAIERELEPLHAQQTATRPSAPAQALAKATEAAGEAIDTSREGWRTALPVREKFAGSIPGQVVTGLGQAVGSLPAYLTGVGIPAGLAQAFDQGYQEAKAYKPDDEEGAVAAGLAVLPSGALDAAAEKFSLGPLLKVAQGAERTTALRGVARKLLETAKAAGSEGATEAAQQVWQNKVAQTSYDPTRKLGEGVPEAAAVGSIVGGGVHAGGQVLEWLDTGRNVPESAATLRAQQADLLAGRRAVQMYPKGTGSELALPDGLARLETARGVFHYDPQQIDAETIQRKSAEGRENELLGLGSLSKADVGRRAQQTGEPIVAVTERSADGTERRSAVATTGTAAQTAREMRQMQAPGATIQVEPVGQTIVERLQAQRQEAEAGQAEATAREERRRTQARAEIAAKRARFDEALALARQTYANPARTYAEVQGALNRVRLYAEDASLGLDQMQREAARKATAALEQMERQMSPAEEAQRARRQQQAEADAKTRATVAAEQRALENKRWAAARRAGIGPDGKLDYNRLSDERLADMAQSGDATAEKLYMERQALPANSRGEELLAVLPRVKLAFNDDALGGELKQLLFEEMTPIQRRKFADARGKHLDRAAEILREDYGFSKILTPADVIDHISRALRGEDVRPDHVGGMDVEYAAAARRVNPLTAGITEETLDAPLAIVPADVPENWQGRDNVANARMLREKFKALEEKIYAGVRIGNQGIKHLARLLPDADAFRVAAQLPQLLQNSVVLASEPHQTTEGALVERRLAAVDLDGKIMPVRLTVTRGSQGAHLYHLDVVNERALASGISPTLASGPSGIETKRPLLTVRDLLPNVKPDGRGTWQADFATERTGGIAQVMTSEAERERLLEAVRASAPALLKEYDLEAGFLDEILRRYAVKHGQRSDPVPPEAVAATRRLAGSRGIIALSAAALDSSTRTAGLLTHEIGHIYWATLPEETQRLLTEQHRREIAARSGPLYRDGRLVSSLSYVAEMSERGTKEWFAERIARLNEDWAKGRIDRAWRAGDMTLARLAQQLRDWVWKVWQALIRARGGDADAELFQARFRDFWRRGDRSVGHRAGLAYAQEMATEYATADSSARKAELLEQLRKGREQRDAGEMAGDLEAEQAGVAAVKRARETLDDEFPGWTEPMGTDEARHLPPEPEVQPSEASPFPVGDPLPPVRAEKTAAVYGDSAAELRWWEKPWRVVRDSLRGWKGAVPELPAFPAARWNAHDEFIQREGSHFYDRAKELYRVLVSSNDHIQARAADQVDAVVGGLLKIPGGLDAEGYRRLGQLREMQRRAKAEGRAFPSAKLAEVSQLQASLESSPYVLFERLVLMLDYQWRATHLKDSRGEPITLPGGLNLSEVDAELKRLGQLVQASAHREAIERAVEQHVHTVRTVADDLRQRGLMMGDHLVNPYYFPHLTLEVSRNGKTEQRMLEPARVRPTTDADFREYLIEPVGSKKPIETDYVRAMYYHLVQVGAHNLRADAVQDYAKPYDVRAKVEKRAQELSKARGTPVSWEQAFHEEFAPQGYVLYGTDSGDAFPVVTIDRNRLAERIGHMLESTDLQSQLRELEVKGIKLLPEDLSEIMQQGAREVWVLPARVAEALKGVALRAERQLAAETKVTKYATGIWKKNKLFMPQNHIRYECGNLVADLEKVFSGDPGMVRMMPRAAKEVREFYTTGAGSDLLRAALKEGVLNSVTAQEMAQLRELPQFEAFRTKGDVIGQQVTHRLSTLLMQPALLAADAATGGDFAHGLSSKSSVEISAMREAVFRYAKFLSDHQKITNGATPAYAGAYWRDIEAIGDSREGAGDAAVRKAAAISRATFGDYGMLSVTGQWIRDHVIPFYSWIEVNFKYHANLLRNLRDQISGAMARDAGGDAWADRRAAAGFALRLMLPYVAVAIWNNSDDREELEDTLSAEDRRRFHIIVGKDDEGRTRVVYGNTAFMDVMRWFSGPQFTQLAADYLAGRTDAATAFSAWKDGLIPDALNNTLGGMTPVARVPVAWATKKSFFPDVTDPKNIPAYDMRRTVLSMLTDDFTADVIERAVNKDYVAPKDMGDWARQLILQQRLRDPESWAYYAMRDKASDFLEQRTGQVRDTSYDAPDQQVLRNFRRAIYRGDAQTAMRMYSRALELGYTAERFAASVRAQDPLAALSKKDGLRREFVTTLSEFDRKQLQRAFQYYVRMDVMRGRERQLFPRDNMSPAMQARRAENPRFDLLQGLMEASMKAAEDEVRQRAERAQRRSLAPSRN